MFTLLIMPIAANLAGSPVLPAMKVVICHTMSASTSEQNDGTTKTVISFNKPQVSIFSFYAINDSALLDYELRFDLESNRTFKCIGF